MAAIDTIDTVNTRSEPHIYLSSASSTDTVLRTTGILALVGVALIHFVQIVDTFNQTPSLGVAFVVLIAASLVVALMLVGGSIRLAWAGAALVGAAAIVGYVFTRSVSTTFDNTDVGNWSETLGMAALFVESMLVLLSAYAIGILSARQAG
jgi:hypothetical protein